MIGYKDAKTERNCGNCLYVRSHLSRGMICAYNDASVSPNKVCALWIAMPAKIKKEKGEQEELF
jgi:hypothetical protein